MTHNSQFLLFDSSRFHSSFLSIVLVGVPNLAAIFVQHQFALVGQGQRTCLAAACVRAGVPSGLVFVVVHDQVAVFLHDQTGCI